MSDENDSWLEGIGVDVSGIVGSVPEFEPSVATDSFATGVEQAASGIWEAASSAGRAAGNLAEAGWDAAAGAGATVFSEAAGAAAGAASYVGADDTAEDLRAAQATAEADANRYFGEADRELADGIREIDETWLPPGYPFPTPPPVPDDPPDLPPDSRPVPVPPGPEPEFGSRGDDDLPDTQPRPGPQPDPDRPPDSQLPPTLPRPFPTPSPDRPPDSQLPPTLPRPFLEEGLQGFDILPKHEATSATEEEGSWLESLGIGPSAFLNDSSGGPPPGRDDPLVGQNKPIDPDDKFAGIKGTFDEILGALGISGVFSDVPGAKGDPAEFQPEPGRQQKRSGGGAAGPGPSGDFRPPAKQGTPVVVADFDEGTMGVSQVIKAISAHSEPDPGSGTIHVAYFHDDKKTDFQDAEARAEQWRKAIEQMVDKRRYQVTKRVFVKSTGQLAAGFNNLGSHDVAVIFIPPG